MEDNYKNPLDGLYEIVGDLWSRQKLEQESQRLNQEIRKQAEADALLEKKKAEDDIRKEIADVSAQLTEKLLEREIRPEDHRELIDSFLQEL